MINNTSSAQKQIPDWLESFSQLIAKAPQDKPVRAQQQIRSRSISHHSNKRSNKIFFTLGHNGRGSKE